MSSTMRSFESLFGDLWFQVLVKTPSDRRAILCSDLLAAGALLPSGPDGYAPTYVTLPADERKARGVELALLNFLTTEMARQLAVKDDDGKECFELTLPDTVLHEHGVRHNPGLCQHCRDDGRLWAFQRR